MKQIHHLLQQSLFPVFFITFLDQIAITICFPVLTFICFDTHSNLFPATADHAIRSYWFGILSALPHLVPIIVAPLLGMMSDIFGRKKLLLIGAMGIVFYGVFTSTSILYHFLPLLLFGYLISGFCVRTEPIALAVVADCSDDNNKLTRMGYLQFYISLGAMIGPLLGGFLVHRFFFNTLNFSLPYMACTLTGLITVFATQFLFKETHHHPHSFKQLKSSWREIFNRQMVFIMIVLIITQIAWRFYYQFIPPILKINAHYSGSQIGLFMSMIAVWLALASSLGIKCLNSFFSKKQILRLCLFAMMMGLIMAIASFYIQNTFIKMGLIWLSAIPIATGDVIIFSMISAAFSTLVSKHHHGKMMGLNFIIVSIVWALTGLLGGYLFAINIQLPILLALFLFLILFVLPNRNLLFNAVTGLVISGTGSSPAPDVK